jgi:hypothetical protein
LGRPRRPAAQAKHQGRGNTEAVHSRDRIETRRGHRSRGKFGVPDPAAFWRAICCIATNAASRSSRPRVARWTTTSNLIAVRRLLLAPDDPEVCGPAPAATRPPAPNTSHDVDVPAAARRNRSLTRWVTVVLPSGPAGDRHRPVRAGALRLDAYTSHANAAARSAQTRQRRCGRKSPASPESAGER